MEKDKTLYVVSGFMRTGTSMMMKALEAGGLDAEYKQSRDVMKNRYKDDHYDPNLGGLYELEREDYKKWNFPKGYEGKLIKCLNKGVSLMATMPSGIRVVFMRRDTEEIRQSYDAFFGNQLRNIEHLERNTKDTLERIRNRKDILSLHIFWFDEVIKDPKGHFGILRDEGWSIDSAKAALVVEPKLYRFRKEELVEGVI